MCDETPAFAEPPESDPPSSSHDPFGAIRIPDFRLWFIGSVITTLGSQMLGTAIGWELYERTRSAFALGLVGLVQIIPVLALFLPAGHLADRIDRKKIILTCQLMLAAGSFALAVLSGLRGPVWMIYVILLLLGIAQAFYSPARSAMMAQLVPRAIFSNAATWGSGGFQIASAVGPGMAGLVIGITHRATPVYVIDGVTTLICFCLILPIATRHVRLPSRDLTLAELVAGLKFVVKTKIIFASITLDMFAVLLGGATTLLPIFAKDILHVGPVGYGWLRAAPGLGACLMSVAIAARPPFRNAGPTLLWAVAGFGAATIVFGISHIFWLSLAMLFMTGALDNISVVIRHTLVQVGTPDSLRGRVSAVNGVFIGASNQLGEFESGLVASLFGPLVSVVSGGVGTILVVIAAALIWPEMRRLGRLNQE